MAHPGRPAVDIISYRGPLSFAVLLFQGKKGDQTTGRHAAPPPAISPVPRPDLVEQANEDDAGVPLLGWIGEVIKTNDIAMRLDGGDDTCIWPHGRACCRNMTTGRSNRISKRSLSCRMPLLRTISARHGFGQPINHHSPSWPRGLGPDMRRLSCGWLDVTVAAFPSLPLGDGLSSIVHLETHNMSLLGLERTYVRHHVPASGNCMTTPARVNKTLQPATAWQARNATAP